jgi:DNA modification methylase
METNAVYCGDASGVLRKFPENSVDLIYADPPFFTNKQYEIIWKDGYEVRSFEDRWAGGIQNYIAWMEPKIRECERVLKTTGSMYLHCDQHANAHLRLLMDKIFGANHFVNEIIWCYTGPRKSPNSFSRKHDMILIYSKTNNYVFNEQRIPHKSGVHNTGQVFASSEQANPDLKTMMEQNGKLLEDWWVDVWSTDRYRDELMGYPTQKPVRLLERIISASSNPTDIVLDPFCGCGTAIVAAHKLGRRWIGVDVSPTACKVMVKRMKQMNVEAKVISLPKTMREVKELQPFEFQSWVIERLEARPSQRKVGDMGVDGFTVEGRPIQVKHSEDIGRNVIDNFETALRRVHQKDGMIVAFSFTKSAYEEVARAKMEDGLHIGLMTVEEMLKIYG